MMPILDVVVSPVEEAIYSLSNSWPIVLAAAAVIAVVVILLIVRNKKK